MGELKPALEKSKAPGEERRGYHRTPLTGSLRLEADGPLPAIDRISALAGAHVLLSLGDSETNSMISISSVYEPCKPQ